MGKYNKQVFSILESKIGSKQGVYSSIRRAEKIYNAYNSEIIFYFIAAKKGVKISKYGLNNYTLEKVNELLEKDKNKGKPKPLTKDVIERKIGKETPYEFPISGFNLNSELAKDCSPLFKKPFRASIREALLNLEHHMRVKLNSEQDGRDLIKEAKEKGVFSRKKRNESDGLYFLFSGTILWLRNPPNHKKLKYDREEAVKIILFIDYLIELFDQLCLENNIK